MAAICCERRGRTQAEIDRSFYTYVPSRRQPCREGRSFVREVVPYEKDPRRDQHGPTDELVQEMRAKAREAGVLTPHILADGEPSDPARDGRSCCTQSGLSPLGPLACNTMAPDEGNMYLLGKVGSAEQKERFLEAAGRGQRALGLLHDRAGRRGRRGLRPVDDEDHLPCSTAITG